MAGTQALDPESGYGYAVYLGDYAARRGRAGRGINSVRNKRYLKGI
jgi:hypothetical protein